MTNDTETPLPKRRSKIRSLLILLTIVISVLLFLAQTFISEIDDLTAVGLDVVNAVSLLCVLSLLLAWVVWLAFGSRLPRPIRFVSALLLAALPVAAVFVLRPVLDGAISISRLEPIWNQRVEAGEVDVIANVDGVDLSTEAETDFPRFLGPNQNAVVSVGASNLIDAEKFAECEPVWKQPIGSGWSGFVVRNGFAVTMEQRGDRECVVCYDIENGEANWVYEHAARHCDAMNLGRTGPRSTPTIHNGDVFAVGAVGNFVCLNGADGTVKWQHNLLEILGVELEVASDGSQTEADSGLAWGRAGSPLIVGDTVVVPGGGRLDGKKTTLLAFDIQSGKLAWQGGDEMISYSSPTLVSLAGRQQILYTAQSFVMGFDPESGKELWRHARIGDSGSAANTSQAMVIGSNRVLTSKGYPDGGGTLIELTTKGDKLETKKIWDDYKVLKTKLTSPVIFEGHSYALSNGFLECVDLFDNGKRIWKQRGRFGHGQILLVGNQLLVHTEYGVLHLVAAKPDGYEELASFKTIDGVCWNTLCLSGSTLLVRSDIEAARFDLPVQHSIEDQAPTQ